MEAEWLRSPAEQKFVFKFGSLPDPPARAANCPGFLAGASTSLLPGRENREDMSGCQWNGRGDRSQFWV